MIEDMLHKLDGEQKLAVESPRGHVLVVAGPGSGKTTVLTARYLKYLKEGLSPDTLCAITFTNRAALQMRRRIEDSLGGSLELPFVDTFHGLALKVLRAQGSTFRLYGREEAVALLKELGIKAPSKTAERLSLIKNRVIKDPSEEEKEALTLYTEELRRRDALDLDDLLVELCRLVEKGGGPLFSHLLVDEFQDINPLQAELVRLFVDRGAELFAIGDPDQSIYGFRGANLEGFLRFKESYPEATLITLKKNYRSCEPIVAVATALIENNKERIAHPVEVVKRGGNRVIQARFSNDKEEAEFVSSQIEALMGGLSSLGTGGDGAGYSFSDFAVLFRTHRQILLFEEVFRASSIPYRLVSTPEGIKRLIEGLKAMEAAELSPEGLAELARASALAEEETAFILTLAQECATKEELTERLILMDIPDMAGIKAERVSLLTMHAAKGLEFRVVFLTGCDEGIVPLKGEDIEEERRLFYVALTRASERLYLTGADRRRHHPEPLKKSRFLEEMPKEFMEEHKRKAKKRRPFQRGLFD